MSKTTDNGCTEAEAMSALSMAQAMMDAYEVTDEDLRIVREEESAIIDFSNTKDTHKIGYKLGYFIGKFTETLCYRSRSFDRKETMKFVGLKADVEFAIFLHDSLIQFVRNQLKDYLWSNNLTVLQGAERHRVVSSFVIGCCSRINQRLKELVDNHKVSANSTALVIAKQSLIKDAMNGINIKAADNRGRKNKIESDSFAAGRTAGDRASFGRPVTGSNAVLRLK